MFETHPLFCFSLGYVAARYNSCQGMPKTASSILSVPSSSIQRDDSITNWKKHKLYDILYE